MAYEGALDGRDCADSSGGYHRYGADMNVFGAIGNSEELPIRYRTTISQDHERPALGCQIIVGDFGGLESTSAMPNRGNYRSVNGQGVAQGWHQTAMTSSSVSPEWNPTGGPNLTLLQQIDRNDSTVFNRLETPYNDEQLWLANRLPSEPWNPLRLLDHQSCHRHLCNATPFISIESPTGERTAGNLGYDVARTLDSHVSATPTSRASCTIESQRRMEDQSKLHLHTKMYDQPSPPRRCLGGSVESAPSRLYGRDSDYAATFAEVSGGPYYNNLFNVPDPQRGQQDLLIPTCVPISSLATDMSRVSSTQTEEELYCPESGCSASFRRLYAKGSLARHRRLKHGNHEGQEAREYNCEEPGCSKTYKRQDARVKHYRKQHQHLAPGPVLSRKKYRSM